MFYSGSGICLITRLGCKILKQNEGKISGLKVSVTGQN